MSEPQVLIDKTLQRPATTTSFHALPLNIRLLIYKYIFEPEVLLITLRPDGKDDVVARFANTDAGTRNEFVPRDFSIRKPFFNTDDQPQRAPNLDILYLSKTVRIEALPFSYTSFTFSFFQPDLYECFLPALPAEYRQNVRHIALDFGLNWMQDPHGDSGWPYTLYERQLFQIGYSPERLHRIFSKDASDEEWYGALLPPTLHCLEARMWDFLDIDEFDSYLDHRNRLVFPVDHSYAINEKVEELRELSDHLNCADPVEKPRMLLQAGAKLSYQLLKKECAARSLPVSLQGFIDGGVSTLREYPLLRLGIICLNVSLKRTGTSIHERAIHLGNASEVRIMMNRLKPTALNDKHRELIS